MPQKKLRKKGKGKRGESPVAVDFISHLTVEECLEHLRSGRSPVKGLYFRVFDDGVRFRIFAVSNIFNSPSIYLAERAAFEGKLEQVEAGTRVQGHARRVGVFNRLLSEPVLVLVGFVLIGVIATGFSWEWVALWSALILTTLVWIGRRADNANWLADYVRERLDVRRDHF